MRNEVKRFDHALLVRLRTAGRLETAALEAARAYIDAQRHRTLVGLPRKTSVPRHRSEMNASSGRQAGVGCVDPKPVADAWRLPAEPTCSR
ncbi:MAG: DUF2950 domain-containing protein [Rhodocyclaceae bacterium]|nr:DUF2950 domain-containing protein [Rhodocyclaceae bacterium]